MQPVMRVLIIEDERKLAEAIATGLAETGYTAKIAHTGEAGLQQLHTEPFDVVLLDVMLPHASGLEALRVMRRDGYEMPVLILTSRGSIEDRVRGLDSGAALLRARRTAPTERGVPQPT
jgi:DNA-binding response OmpR family regulator